MPINLWHDRRARPRLLTITPFDKGVMKVEKAIMESDLRLTPNNDGRSPADPAAGRGAARSKQVRHLAEEVVSLRATCAATPST
jgi:ribosome recycling factor